MRRIKHFVVLTGGGGLVDESGVVNVHCVPSFSCCARTRATGLLLGSNITL